MKKEVHATVARTYCSEHIPLSKVSRKERLICDIDLFNRIKHTAFNLYPEEKGQKPTVHAMMKAQFGTDDYFTGSACQEARSMRETVKKLNEYNRVVWEDAIDQMNEKLDTLRPRLERLEAIKKDLIHCSRMLKNAGIDRAYYFSKSPCFQDKKAYEQVNEDGSFEVGRGKKKVTYKDAYEFEVKYVTPNLTWHTNTINAIEQKIIQTQKKIDRLHESVCFGSKNLFKKQDTVYTDHEEWLNAWHNARYSRMTLQGRYTAAQGNFSVRYDTKTKTLRYSATDGEDILIHDVSFPYGQDDVNKAVMASEETNQYKKYLKHPERFEGKDIPDPWYKEPVTWEFHITGGSLVISCTIHKPASRKNTDTSTGIIGLDKNPDQFGLAEIDENGNILDHKTIPFHVIGKPSDEVERIISEALEEVFEYCRDRKKILAVEEIQTIQKRLMYSKDKETNRILSQFAYDKMDQLIKSKSEKYGIDVIYVNPAYTSQMGKMKYMRRLGLSVHESAAFVIARRALGLKEPLPVEMQQLVKESSRSRHHWKHWAQVYPTTKKLPWRQMYRKIDREHPYEDVDALKDYFDPDGS